MENVRCGRIHETKRNLPGCLQSSCAEVGFFHGFGNRWEERVKIQQDARMAFGIWVFPKIVVKPPKWMVKIMENPIEMG